MSPAAPGPRDRLRAVLGRIPAAEFPGTGDPEPAREMLAALELFGGERVLLLAPRSPWLAAVLAELAGAVHVLLPEGADARSFAAALARRGCGNVQVHTGPLRAGLPGHFPFDSILVDGALPAWPPALLDQLAPGGRLVAALGPPGGQQLRLLQNAAGGQPARVRDLGPVRLPSLPGDTTGP